MEFVFTDPATDFTDGLEVLKKYHQDFLLHNHNLLALVEEIKQHGMSKAIAEQCIAEYWHHSMINQLHHQDEEQFVFPLLIQKSVEMRDIISRLEQGHQEIDKLWDELALLITEPEAITDFELLETQIQTFVQLLQKHIKEEDKLLKPELERLLSLEQRQQIGQNMLKARQWQADEVN